MGHLSNQLAALVKPAKGTNARKAWGHQIVVAERTGLSRANISRIFSGRQEFVSSEDLDKIIAAVAKSQQDRAKLVRARLRDAYKGDSAGLVNITIKGGSTPNERFVPDEVSIDPRVNAAFEFLYKLVPSNPYIGKMMLELALGHGMK